MKGWKEWNIGLKKNRGILKWWNIGIMRERKKMGR
jgi:hypothetical protein